MKILLEKIFFFIKTDYYRRKEVLDKSGIYYYLANSSGYVLVIVLLVSSMLVSISTEFLIIAQTNINYTKKFSERLKAYSLAKAGVSLSTFALKVDKMGLASGLLSGKSVDRSIDCYEDLWAMRFPELPLEDGSIKIAISDENSKINLSILANEFVEKTPYYLITQRFFLNMELPMDFADVIIDWIDIDDSRFPYGAESSDYYLTLSNPYNAKNNQMDSIDELLLLKGITPKIFYGLANDTPGVEENLVDDNTGINQFDFSLLEDSTPEDILNRDAETGSDLEDITRKIGKEKSRRLSDYLRVNGERSDYLKKLNRININTASYRVLSALTDNMTDDIVTELISRRIVKPFKSVNEIKDLINDETVTKNILTVKSFLFKIVSIGRVNNTSIKIICIYYRDGKRFLFWSEQ